MRFAVSQNSTSFIFGECLGRQRTTIDNVQEKTSIATRLEVLMRKYIHYSWLFCVLSGLSDPKVRFVALGVSPVRMGVPVKHARVVRSNMGNQDEKNL